METDWKIYSGENKKLAMKNVGKFMDYAQAEEDFVHQLPLKGLDTKVMENEGIFLVDKKAATNHRTH